MKHKFTLLIILLVLGAGLLSAQSQKVILSFFENNSGDFKIVNPDESDELYGDELEFDTEVPIGWTVVTGNGDSAELRIEPNRTIIKIAENTNFRCDGLQGLSGSEANRFSLGFGKIRAVAGKITGNEKYIIKGKSAACGVRGTDWYQQVIQGIDGKILEEVLVFDGVVEYSLLADPAKKILVKAGEYADALADQFKALPAPQSMIDEVRKAVEFKSLDPADVPKTPKVTSVSEPKTGKEPEPEPEVEEEPEGFLYKMLSDVLGFEIGSITVDGEIYAKAVAAPTFRLGKLKMSLYLPVIYKGNMMDPNDWYKPNGNNEWSFGFDQGDDWWAITGDVVTDLALKIKYIQWGNLRDPFFFKVGNVNDFTVGHGLIMRNYANDSDFPAIRRVGVNLGLDFTKFGFETVVNDLAEPEIFGARLYTRPFAPGFPLAFGITGIADIAPAAGSSVQASIGNPILINTGLDLDFPIVEKDLLSIILFGDVAGLIPYYRNNGSGAYSNVTQGFDWDTLVNMTGGFSLRNIGAAAGLLGNVGPVDWRLEYRCYTGTFKPAIFNAVYDRKRLDYAINAAAYSDNPSDPAYDSVNMGIYGEAGYTLAKVFSFSAGYEWPFIISDSGFAPSEEDYLFMKASLERGVIPVVDVGVSIEYERYYFAPMLLRGVTKDGIALSLFDANTVVKTRLIYGVSKNIDLVMLLSTALVRNEVGSVWYDPTTYKPEVGTTMSIETSFHF
jgi:hypothetical protein